LIVKDKSIERIEAFTSFLVKSIFKLVLDCGGWVDANKWWSERDKPYVRES